MDISTLPTAGGYEGVWTPREIHGTQHGRVIETPEQLLQLHVLQLAMFHKPGQWRYIGQVDAFISANRWMFQCPHCHGGVSCGPHWSVACCFECGAVFDTVMFPENWQAIEAALQARPGLFARHWGLGETVDALGAENEAHGLARGEQ